MGSDDSPPADDGDDDAATDDDPPGTDHDPPADDTGDSGDDGDDTEPEPIPGLADDVAAWNFYPSDPALWTLSSEPFDYDVDGARWLAEPTDEGTIRCLVENDVPTSNAGFYLDIGPIGNVDTLEIDSESLASTDDEATLAVALYFDVTGSGQYFEWNEYDGPMERFVGLGGDVEGLAFEWPAGGTLTVDADAEFLHVPTLVEDDFYPATLGEYTAGVIPDVTPETNAALHVGVVGAGEGTSEEACIEDVRVNRTDEFTLVDAIDRIGHWATFPDNPELWHRSHSPIDITHPIEADDGTELEGRWLAEPANGAVRARVENDVPTGNAGFDVEIGRLGDIGSITIDAETIETGDGDEAALWVGVYFDTQGTGDYFEWGAADDGTEPFTGFGDDGECLHTFSVDPDGVTIDLETEWDVLMVPADNAPPDAGEKGWIVDDEFFGFAMAPMPAAVTLKDYLVGEVTIDDDDISLDTDDQTRVALAINCIAGGHGATEEVRVTGYDVS